MAETKGSAQRGWLWIAIILAAIVWWISNAFNRPTEPPTASVSTTPLPTPPPAAVDPKEQARLDRISSLASLVVGLKAAARNPDSFVLERVIDMPDGALISASMTSASRRVDRRPGCATARRP